MAGKLFDLHFEVGIDPSTGQFYAKTILGSNGVIFEEQGASPGHAIAKTGASLEQAGMWNLIAQNPLMSTYPFGTTTNAKPKTLNAYDPTLPKKRPADIFSEAHPGCQAMCQSFDNFGDAKCKSICAHRTGL
jgi:hypothetical protein